jgi:tyrosyl-tRNA synthetase
MSAQVVQDQLKRLTRHADRVVRPEELAERLSEGRPLRVKLGVDPTARDITLGWAVPLRKLRQFQDEGHTAVLIMGDFTARIGDPSGKSATRPQMEESAVRANAEACVAQLLDILSEDNLEIRYNSEWLAPLDLPGVLRLTAQYTVAQMLERDDFSKRFGEQQPISVIEFMYPLLQAYDSVAVEADVELGGSDQLFNLLVGRDLQRAYGQRAQIVLTMPLLVGLDGVQKMSQSFGNYVAIRDKAEEMFGKLMSIPDDVVGEYAALAADLDEQEVRDLAAAAAVGGPEAGQAKRTVARGVVALYHGPGDAEAAEAAFDRQFREHRPPEELMESPIPGDAVDGELVYLPRVLAELGLAASRSEARRLISQGGVKVNGVVVSQEEVALANLQGSLLQVGRRRFRRLTDPA